MTQITLTALRQAVATQLQAQIPGLRVVTSRLGDINPPCAVIAPQTGPVAEYQVSMDGQVDWHLRIVMVASVADSTSGQDILDPYLSVTGPQSIWAAIRADTSLGGMVGFAIVTAADGYGVMNINGVDYLAVSFTLDAGE